MKARSFTGIIATGLLAVMVFSMTPSHAVPGPNLLPNAGFEKSQLEPAGVIPQYTLDVLTPALPEGWAFEGAAGLFDHSPQDHRTNTPTNRRMAAISIPASGKRNVCADAQTCAPMGPVNGAKDTSYLAYSVTPCWRTLNPVINLSGSTSYTLSMYTRLMLATIAEGASMRVRWLDANNVPVAFGVGPERRAVSVQEVDTGWVFVTQALTSPSAARRAHILLCATDDSWISQIRFDDVFFGKTVA